MRTSLLFLLALPASAQEYRATISGLVTDPSSAPVAGARILVTSIERKVSYEGLTNESGRYLTRFLPPGQYTLTAEKDGFKKAVRDGLALSAVDRLNLDVRLELGAVAESVTVTGEASALATETASRAATIEQKFVEDIPSSGRNLYQLLFTLPGVTKSSRYWGSFELYAFGNINSIMINGGRSGENETLVDGITSTRGSRSASFAPALNAIQEVNVLTNSYDSQYGRIGGGVTSVTLRTGSNSIHGQLFEFFKNDNLNANGYSRNSIGLKQPEFKNNTFGFTVDGPFYVPKVFDGRNRMFFMISLEGLRERNPQTQIWTVPTERELQGDFSQLVDNSLRPILLYDPLTTRQVDGRFVRTPFTGNLIPRNRMNPVASKAAGYYPRPNRASESPDGQNNYLFVNSSRNNYDQWIGKLDWNISSRSRVSGRYGETPWYNYARVQWGTNAAEPSSEYPSTRISRNWGLDWTYTLSPTLVLNVRAGLARYEGFSGNEFGRGFDPRELGFPSSLVSQFVGLQYPRFNLSGNNYSPLGATQTSGYETQDSYSLQPNLQMIRGKHNLKFGTEVRLYNSSNIRPASASGNYSFGRNWTQADPQRGDALSGNVLATFLLGNPTSGFADRNSDPSYQNRYFMLFLQDDWKIARKVTVNAGLRWDYEGPLYERYNRIIRGFAFDQASPIASQVQGLTLKGGLLYAGPSGADRLSFHRDWNNIQPRIGVAWQVREKWVVRGGYGLFFLGQNAAGPDTGFSRRTDLVASTDNNLTPAVTLSDPFPLSLFPAGLLQPIGSTQGLSTNLGLGIGAQFLDRPLPYSQQFSFGFQRSLPWQWVMDASYVGNLTSKLPIGANLNFLAVDVLNSVPAAERPAYFSAQAPNPMRGLLPGSAFNGATVPRQQLLYAYPHFAQVGISNVAAGSQSYHSLQMKGTRRYRNGIAAQVAYTWSKTLERIASLNAQDVNLRDLTATGLEQRLVEFDIPHTFSGVVTYELPFGRGRKFFGKANKFASALFGGWNVNVQYVYRSGQPIDFPNAAPAAARSARLTGEQRDELAVKAGRDKFNPFFDKWFDTSIFPRTAQAPFTLRDFPTRFPDVRSPYLQSWEISGYKEFRITERARFQFRADFQNAFDYAYFGRLISRPNNVQDARFGQLDPAQDNQPRVVVLVAKILF
ncbi:MAG: TonB-dependent receptor [Acidobacteria bacterium]|nr:TonB-dependent receptor [Acidobacteriota bacterium]